MGGTGRILRYSTLFVAIGAIFACATAASASAAPLAFVAEEGSHAVSAIDTGTNQVVGDPIEVGAGPASVAITPDGKYAFVADFEDEAVSVIETGLRRTVGEPIQVGKNPYGLAITPDGKYAFVTDRGSDEVSVIETQTRKVVAEIEVGANPTGVAISPNGAYAYIADSEAEKVELISTETMKVVGTPIKVGEKPMGIEFTPNGKTAYVVDETGKEVSAIETTSRDVTSIPLAGESPRGIAVTPDGSKAYVVSLGAHLVSVISTATDLVIGEITLAAAPEEVSIAPDGKTVYVTESGTPQVQRIDGATGAIVGSPIAMPGIGPGGIAITPDQSPIAAFTAPSATATFPATFDGSASTDPDGGLISSYAWSFGEGGVATGPSVSHTYGLPGTYDAKLSVTDNEGCGEAEVFTGRTAYCSGGASSVTHQVTVAKPPLACSAKFGVRRLLHNRKNGTVRMQVKLPGAGFLFLFGKKVHAITRKVRKAGPTWLTIHARVELNKRLKKTHRERVQTRITFTPNAGCGYKTVHRSFALLRRKHHH